MSSDNKNSNIKTLLGKIKDIQNKSKYKPIKDMELNKYYKIENAEYGKNVFGDVSATITIEENGQLYFLILPKKYVFNESDCSELIKCCEIGVIELGKRKEIDFREVKNLN